MQVKKNLDLLAQKPTLIEEPENDSKWMRWTGLSDLIEGRKYYQNKEWKSALKCAGLGCAKMGTITAALYGSYKWASGSVVHLNDFITQSDAIFQKKSGESFSPKSVDQLIDALYVEQKTFKKWPKSGQEFFLRHLGSDYPMSAAIVEKMFQKADEKSDSTFRRIAIKACKSAKSSTLSCVRAGNILTEDGKSDSLSTSLSIVRQCRKTNNAFCQAALQSALKQSIQEKMLPDISSLANLLRKRTLSIDPKEVAVFADKAADLSFPEIEKKRQKMEECRAAANQNAKKESPEWDLCYAHRNWLDTLEELDRPWHFERNFLKGKADALEKEFKDALQVHGVGIALLASSLPHSSAGTKFVEEMFERLVETNQSDDAVRLLESNPQALQTKIPAVIRQLVQAAKWEEAIRFFTNLEKKQPAFDIRRYVQNFVQDLLKSSKAHLAFELLYLKGALKLFDVKEILDKAFNETNEDHLHKVYLLGKSWVAKKDPAFDPHLTHLIDKMFATSSGQSYSWRDSLNTYMAKALATQWILSKNPSRWTRLELESEWTLTGRAGSRWDYHHPKLAQSNWKKMAGIAP